MNIYNDTKWLILDAIAMLAFIFVFKYALDYHPWATFPLLIIAAIGAAILQAAPKWERSGKLNISFHSGFNVFSTGNGGENMLVGGGKNNKMHIFRVTGPPMDEKSMAEFFRYLAMYNIFHITDLPDNEVLVNHSDIAKEKIFDEDDPAKRIKLYSHANEVLGMGLRPSSTIILAVDMERNQLPPQWPGLVIEPMNPEEYAIKWRDIV